MRTFSVRKGMALSACAVLAVSLGAATQAQGSTYTHPSPVLTNPANYTPNLVDTGDRKPVAYAAAEAGTQMVVGGDFNAVENSTRTTQYNRSNVFAFNATTGVVNPDFHPQVDGDVWSVLVNGDSVYIGGGFKNVNGQPRAALAMSASRPVSSTRASSPRSRAPGSVTWRSPTVSSSSRAPSSRG